MIVEVFSIMSAVGGNPSGTTWRGEIPIGFNGHYGSTLEHIFRFFNRVDEADGDRLEELGYNMPSLSVGDYLTLHFDGTGTEGPINKPRTWRCTGHGFEEITGNRNVIMEEFK